VVLVCRGTYFILDVLHISGSLPQGLALVSHVWRLNFPSI